MFDLKPTLIGNLGLDFGKKAEISPVLEIVGGGNGWTKETHGQVGIKAVSGRTTVKLTGAGAWKISGPEIIG